MELELGRRVNHRTIVTGTLLCMHSYYYLPFDDVTEYNFLQILPQMTKEDESKHFYHASMRIIRAILSLSLIPTRLVLISIIIFSTHKIRA